VSSNSQKISIIIPTKDRPQDLARCLESLSNQTLLPDEIIIVDASDMEELDSSVIAKLNKKIKTTHLHTAAGLTHQKNVGVKACTGDIIFVLDDDVVLKEDFVKEIVDVFDNDSERKVAGVCGRIVSTQKHDSRSLRSMLVAAIGAVHRAIAVVFLLRKRGDGTFRASGFPNYPYATSEVKRVEFLPGGLTAWRKEILSEFKFDEKLEGPSILEDVDFSYRVSRKYVNIYTPRAELVHNPSPVARIDTIARGKMLIENSYYLFKKNLPQTLKYKLAFYWAVVGLGLVAILYGIAGRNIELLKGLAAGLVSMKRIDKRNNQE